MRTISTRDELAARCAVCDHKGSGVGCCLSAVKGPICLKAPMGKHAGLFRSIFAVLVCPLGKRGAKAKKLEWGVGEFGSTDLHEGEKAE